MKKCPLPGLLFGWRWVRCSAAYPYKASHNKRPRRYAVMFVSAARGRWFESTRAYPSKTIPAAK